jgi:adenine-specific DNA-methyltransferase
MEFVDLVNFSFEQGKKALEKRKIETLKEYGQYLTPPKIARYMSKQLGEIKNGDHILEPAIGSGVLACAVVERLIEEQKPIEIWLTAYEVDQELCGISHKVLDMVSQQAEKKGIKVHWQVFQEDFILSCLPEKQPSLFNSTNTAHDEFNLVISNPPYFKLNTDDIRVKASVGNLNGHTNIYTLFMALSTKLLSQQGRACFIVPRSFCSGVYFSEFRRELLKNVTPLTIHLFQSRNDVFKGDEVLQENVIFSFEKLSASQENRYWAGTVNISTSANVSSFDQAISRQVPFRFFLGDHNGMLFFRLPTGVLDEQILEAVDHWDGSFDRYGFQVSTGRVVPFRAKQLLRDHDNPDQSKKVPLLWMQHIKPYHIEFPLSNFKKPQAISLDDPSLLVPSANYVLIRRFSAKEDRRRIISAPFIKEQFNYEQVGFENHLNVIFKRKGILSTDEAIGFSAILNSSIVDRYFRIVNGNTQVNAAEVRALPLPPLEVIRVIGSKIEGIDNPNSEQIDKIVFTTLWQANMLSDELPMIQETRITMGKIEQAQEILQALGLPSAQQNEISALTLLALSQLSELTPWKDAKSAALRVHDILGEIKERYGREYAENSRETIRRRVLHQFEQAGIVIRNVDDPGRPTNSGLTNYILSDIVLNVLQAYGSSEWDKKQQAFFEQQGKLIEIYLKARNQNMVPLKVADGTVYKLSPGKHNKLQAEIVNEFGPRFAPGANLLYLGDTSQKTIVLNQELMDALRIPASEHGKFADVLLYDAKKNWLFLVEAVTTHGPVSPKRYYELEHLLENCTADRIYVTAFLDFTTFKKFVNDIAWETEVWIAEMPSHMIHFNGDKFLGPK